MDRHVCKQCGRVYNYCRACVLKTIPWRAAGFCSRECSAAFKTPKIEIPENIELEQKPKVRRKPKAEIVDAIEMVSENIQDGIHE